MGTCSGTTAGTFHAVSDKFRYCDGNDWFWTGAPVSEFKGIQETTETLNNNAVSTGAFSYRVSNHSLLLCMVLYNSSAVSVSSLTDSSGNTYAKAVGPQTGTGSLASWRQEIWYAANVTGHNSLNVTATLSGTFSGNKAISCSEFVGAALTSPVDQVSQAAGNSANAVAPAVTTTQNKELLFAAAAYATSGNGGASFTQISSINNNAIEYQIVNSTGTYSGTFNNSSMRWIAQLVTIKLQ